MQPAIKPIETVYNGYRFRSRLEARWAVFFDTLGVPYEYEKEGYDLGQAGWYLPDFWLPEQDCWVEIKGCYPSLKERRKIACLAEMTRKDAYLFTHSDFGPPRFDWDTGRFLGSCASRFASEHYDDEGDFGFEWGHCGACFLLDPMRTAGYVGIPKSNAWLAHFERAHPSIVWKIDRLCLPNTPRLIAAYQAAKSARFEHGANGR